MRWVLILLPVALLALPTDFQCVKGDATLGVSSEGAMLVRCQENSVIHWTDFSVGALEEIRFDQAGVRSAVLNRVSGDLPSRIDGRLTSNGQIYLINQKGIYFGKGSFVETAALFASALDVLDADFLDGKLLVRKEGGPLVHEGTIRCTNGDAILLGSTVEQSGEIYVQPTDDADLLIRPQRIEHLSQELAEGNPYLLAIARDPAAAPTIEKSGGKIYLVSNGSVKQKGSSVAAGGEIQMFGAEIEVCNDSMLDVSSEPGGGGIYVGGYARGEEPLTKNAEKTIVYPGAVLRADALDEGDGGEVILWSEGLTAFGGRISARGGMRGGDGGFAEISGAEVMIPGVVELYARDGSGKAGSLLIDPTDITIAATGTPTSTFTSCPDSTYTIVTGTPNTILVSQITAQLSTCNVTIDTASADASQGNISVTGAISSSSTFSLTLKASGSINITAGISITGTAGQNTIDFSTDGTATGTYDGIVIGTGGSITSASGNISLVGKGGNSGACHGIHFSGGSLTVADGATAILTGTGGTGGIASHGIFLDTGSITVGSSSAANAVLLGTGGSGAAGYGVNLASTMTAPTINAGSALYFAGTGGGSLGTNISSAYGVSINKAISTTATGASVQFGYVDPTSMTVYNCQGGGSGSGNSNYGLQIAASVVAPIIQAASYMSSTAHMIGGSTTGGINHGCIVTVSIGSSTATTGTGTLILNGYGGTSAAGTANAACGIFFSGSSAGINIRDGATLDFHGEGGSSATGAQNRGIYFSGGTYNFGGSTSGTGTTATFYGIGGNGSGGSHTGIYYSGTVNGRGAATLLFTGIGGGTASAGNPTSCNGFENQATMTVNNTNGRVQLGPCVGGGTGLGGSNVGFNQSSGGIIAYIIEMQPSTAICMGGNTSGTSNDGIQLSSSIIGTSSIKLKGQGGGTGNNSNGITVLGGFPTINSGTMTLTGIGSQTAGASATGCHGVSASAGRFSIGTSSTIILNGTGGSGGGGTCHGILYSQSSPTFNTNSSIQFFGVGGTAGNNDHGVLISSTSFTVTATGASILFGDCIGGGGASSSTCYGVSVTGSMTAPTIGMTSPSALCTGGGGTGSDNTGIKISGTVGSTTATAITLRGKGGASGSSSYGIDLGGTVVVGDAGAITLTGQGGGAAGLAKSNNWGIHVTAALTLGSTTTASATMTGTGGEGTGGSHYGVYVQSGSAALTGASALTLSGTGGGVGGTNSGSNIGCLYAASYAPTSSAASLKFGNCTGGGFSTDASTGNYGIQINGGLDVATIQMAPSASILGGATQGAGNHGLYISGSSSFIGSSTRADAISLTASAQATGGNSQGIALASGGKIQTVLAGSITLSGTGGGGSTGSANYGVYVTGTGSAISAATGPISVTGVIADTGTTQAILISSNGTVSSTTGNIDLFSTSPKTIAFDSSSSVSSTSGNLSFHGPTVLAGGPVALTTTGAIHFYSTLNGAFDLTLASSGSPSSAINFDNAVGGTSALASLTAYGSSITQSSTAATTGALSYTGAISLNGNQTTSGGAVSMNGAVALQQNIAVSSSGGSVSYSSSVDAASNGGQSLQITAGAGTVSFSAAVGATHYLSGLTITSAATTANAVSIGGNISANSFSIVTASPVLLTNSSIIDTSTGPGNISFPSTIDGAFDLTLTPGSGTVTLFGNLGSAIPLGNVSVTTGATSLTLGASSIAAASFTVGSSVPAMLNASLTITTSGATSFGGTINGASAHTQSLAINASGAVTLSENLGNSISLNNVSIAAGATSLALGGSTIDASSFSVGSAVPATLNANLDITTTGAISFGGTVDGAASGMQSLTLDAGSSGTIAFGAAVGATHYLSGLTITSAATTANAVSIGGNIFANSFSIVTASPVLLTNSSIIDTSTGPGNISFPSTIDGAFDLTLTPGSGTVTLFGNLGSAIPLGNVSVTTGATSLTLGASSIAAASFTVGSAVPTTLNASLTVTTTGAISFGGAVDAASSGVQSLTLNAGSSAAFEAVGATAPLAFLTASGDAVLQNATVVTAGPIDYTATTLVRLYGDLTTSGGAMTFDGPTQVRGSIQADTTSGSSMGADIDFTNTIDATMSGVSSLTLVAGSAGKILFGAAIGSGTTMGDIAITSASTTASDAVQIASDITSTSFVIATASPALLNGDSAIDTTLGDGDITFGGTIDGAHNLILTAGAGPISFGAVGSATPLTSLTADGNTITQNDTVQTVGAIDYTGAIALHGDQTTAGGAVSMNGAVTLHQNILVSSSGGNVAYTSSINAVSNGSESLQIAAGSGTVAFDGAIGATHYLSSLTIDSASTLANGVSIGGNISANSFSILTNSPVLLTNSSIIDTSTGPGNISFPSTIDGAFNLTLTPGSGNVTLSGDLGSTTPLGNVSVTSGATLLSLGASSITATSLMVGAAVPTVLDASLSVNTTGLISFGGTVNAAASGVQSLTLDAGSSGTIVFASAVGATHYLGGLSITSAATTANAISIGGNISSDSFSIATVSPVLLTNSSILNTSTGPGNIDIPGTIDGAFNLTFTPGSGSVMLSGDLGNTIALGNVLITAGASALTLGSNSIQASSFAVGGTIPSTLLANLSIATSGATSFGGVINGISSHGQSLAISAAGAVTLSGSLGNLISLNNVSIATGATSLALGGSLIDATTFTVGTGVPSTLNSSLSIATTSAISFGGAIDGASAGAQSLTLVPGTIATFSGNIGATRLGNFSITSGSLTFNTSMTSIQVASFSTSAGVATTLKNSSLLTIDSTGNIAFSGTLSGQTAGANSLTLAPIGTATLAANVGSAALGDVTISSGALVLGPAITTLNANTFTTATGVPTTLINSAPMTIATTGAVDFEGTIDGNTSLIVDAGTTATFGADIGASQPLSTLSVAAATIFPPANTYAQGGTLTYSGPVVLSASTLFSDTGSTGILFEDTITGSYDLTITALNGAITAQGTISVLSLDAHSGQDAEFDSSITTTGDASIQSDQASVIVNAITTSSGDIILQPASGFSSGALINLPDGILVLNGNLSAVGKTISLSPAGRTQLLSVATITGPPSGGSVALTADQVNIGGDLLTDQFNESFTVLGTLTINATSSTIVADLIAQDAIVVTAPTIHIFKHLTGQIYDSTGALYDSTQTNILSTTAPSLTGTQAPFGSGSTPLIQAVSLTPSEFGAALVYSGHILDYDLMAPPPPPPPPTPSGNFDQRGNALEKFGLAVSELFYKLPIEWISVRTAPKKRILKR